MNSGCLGVEILSTRSSLPEPHKHLIHDDLSLLNGLAQLKKMGFFIIRLMPYRLPERNNNPKIAIIGSSKLRSVLFVGGNDEGVL